MLSLAEYKAQAVELQQIGEQYEDRIGNAIRDQDKATAVAATRQIVGDYEDEYQDFLRASLMEVADNSTQYYSDNLDIDVPEGLAKKAVDNAWAERYYGASVATRLAFNFHRLNKNIDKSAALNTDHLANLFTKQYPFGAQTNIDRRMLQAMAVKIEQDIAKEFAKLAAIELVRWRLSHRHAQPDICDDYASHVDPEVLRYIEEHNLDIDPKGLYFVSKLPYPPHPNCQCEYMMVKDSRDVPRSRVNRAVSAVRGLLRRLRKK